MRVQKFAMGLILGVTLSCCPVVTGASIEQANKLYEDLFKSYNKQVRPVTQSDQSLEVDIALELGTIVDLSETDQTLTVNALLYMYWSDVRLTWNPTEYGDLKEIFVVQENVWLPDVVVENSVEPPSLPGHDSLKVTVGPAGNVSWKPVSFIKTGCKIDVTYFPFDVQLCEIAFVTAVRSLGVRLKSDSGLIMSQRSPNGKWKAVKGSYDVKKASDTVFLEFFFLMTRRRTFYVMNIVVPVLLLSITSTLVFSLPADAGEKMGASITLLLAFAVYLTILSDQMPNTSLQVSILSTYLLLLLGVSSLTVVLSVFSLRLHHTPEDEPVTPNFAAVSMALRKLLRMKPLRWHSAKQQQECKDAHGEGSLGKNRVTPLQTGPRRLRPSSRGSGCSGVDVNSTEDENDDVLTWQDASATFDHCFFVTFSIIICLCTFLTLLILVIGSDMDLSKKTDQLPGKVKDFDGYLQIGANETYF